jgi:hypothetical protein
MLLKSYGVQSAALFQFFTCLVIPRQYELIDLQLNQCLRRCAFGRLTINACKNGEKRNDAEEGKRNTPLHDDL